MSWPAWWEVRDQSSAQHRAAYTALSRQVPLPDPALHDALYERHMSPAAWSPYPDAMEVLAGLRERGIAVGVVSNIGWDLRPVFRAHGLDRFVGTYALSYEHGIRKPDPRLFRLACTALDADPRTVLMVGDDPDRDGGAAALGCAVRFVDHLPATDDPTACARYSTRSSESPARMWPPASGDPPRRPRQAAYPAGSGHGPAGTR
ncbi:Phosphoglycolate phosphatase [Streptomyces glaucescens]